jgi:endonuclease/exonuclease/phosphatase family metal-dependent hydrolase
MKRPWVRIATVLLLLAAVGAVYLVFLHRGRTLETVPVLPKAKSPVAEIRIPPRPYPLSEGPTLLSYTELSALLASAPLRDPLKTELEQLLTTPFINNEASYRDVTPHRPKISSFGPGLRAVMWNIERGLRLDDIKSVFTSPAQFQGQAEKQGRAVMQELRDEIEIMRSADVFVLNEADWGLKRTNYRNTVQELAIALDMNWAYGVEFVEIDMINLGTEEFRQIEDAEARQALVLETRVVPEKVLALHGTAVLSRYPILEARLEPFKITGYDWFGREKQHVSALEGGKRWTAQTAFQERITREIRRGGRTSLIVTLAVPDLPGGRLTVAATHFESRAMPRIRQIQMRQLLQSLRKVRNPIILAGDLNTTLGNQEPTTLKREVYRRLGSTSFWADKGIKQATGVGMLYDAVKGGLNFAKNLHDPTAKNVPFLGPNPEAALFDLLERFRFQDGTVIDFRGDKQHSINETEGTLANSNQRIGKGFAPTFRVQRTIGPFGTYKLDWMFVKAYLKSPRDSGGPYRFAPHFARTMEDLNYALAEPLSDHSPISVDLPFREPGPSN